MPRDEFSEMRAFLEVARERSFTRAAAKLGLFAGGPRGSTGPLPADQSLGHTSRRRSCSQTRWQRLPVIRACGDPGSTTVNPWRKIQLLPSALVRLKEAAKMLRPPQGQ
jgi:hypothetical protein